MRSTPNPSPTASNAAPAPLEEYHFAGGGEYQPQTVLASNAEDALKQYEATRVSVTPVTN